MENTGHFATQLVAAAARGVSDGESSLCRGHWDIVCRDRFGNEKWQEAIENIVLNEGLNHLLDVTLSGATQDASWFIGLISASPTVAAGNTLALHAGWTEVSAYAEVNRQAWVDAGVSAQSVSNAASPAVFTINANGTDVGGAFLAGVNTGSSGVMYAAGAFTAGNKSLDASDTLSVTFTATAAAA